MNKGGIAREKGTYLHIILELIIADHSSEQLYQSILLPVAPKSSYFLMSLFQNLVLSHFLIFTKMIK